MGLIHPLLPIWAWFLTIIALPLVYIVLRRWALEQARRNKFTIMRGAGLMILGDSLAILFVVITYFATSWIFAVPIAFLISVGILVSLYNFLTIRSKTKKAGRES
ncbi:hypothetical protein Thermo_00855 [Thermoplasmatales archaeon]|nr:hypothetical protein Thermo_00855 [Thermoplasmatales archaeon]